MNRDPRSPSEPRTASPLGTAASSASDSSPAPADARLEELLSRIQNLASDPSSGKKSRQADLVDAVQTAEEQAGLADAPHGSGPQPRPRPAPRQPEPSQPAATAPPRPAVTNKPPTAAAAPAHHSGDSASSGPYLPIEPTSVHDTGLTATEIEALMLKYLQARGDASGRQIADQVTLPFALIDELLRDLKAERLVAYRGTAQMGDYVYQLTDLGRERARRFLLDSTYYGSAPVPLRDYVASVKAQSLTHQRPTEDDLRRAFSDLLINQDMFRRLGPAINSGRGMFLFGYPGNGKTSIAERVTVCFGEEIWIPRALGVDGEVIRVFDPNHHTRVAHVDTEGLLNTSHIDRRWVKIKRPTIVVGGELTMEQLEIQANRNTGINEAPVQLKSNCEMLVIDDFGRQKMRTDELLNRWIVPLEKRYDFLCLPSGKSIQVPFDQLVIFSTNLEPKDLVDDAFLRRIPYKIEVPNPSEEEFTKLFEIMCPIMGFKFEPLAVKYLVEKHYKPIKRPFRCCQPRDLLLQVRNYCLYMKQPLLLTPDRFDFAVENYFSVM